MSTQTQTTTRKRGLFLATVAENTPLCRDHFRLSLTVTNFPPTAPGQFLQLNCHPPFASSDEPDEHAWRNENDPGLRTRSLVAPLPMLRRPFSIAGDEPDASDPTRRRLIIIGRAIGLGTSRLAALPPGEAIDLIGPLGNSFPMPAPGQTALLVGGGVGIPPMIYLAQAVAAAGHAAIAIAGVTTSDFLPLTCDEDIRPNAELPTLCAAEFSRHGVPTMLTSDDGSVGLKGLVTDALARVIDAAKLPPGKLVIYTCGPERMMQAVTRLAVERGIGVWVAMERAMACGIGTCQSCVCKVRAASRGVCPEPRLGIPGPEARAPGPEASVPGPAGSTPGGSGAPGPTEWVYKLVCTDGTIFDGRDIVWE